MHIADAKTPSARTQATAPFKLVNRRRKVKENPAI